MDIPKALDELSEHQTRIQALEIEMRELKDKILEPVKAELEAVDIEYKPILDAVRGEAFSLELRIKDEVKDSGASVKGTWLQAVYAKGRVTWESSKLEGLAIAFPALLQARKEGEPSVSIRAVK